MMIYNDSWLISYTLRRFFVIVVMRGTVCREHRRCVHQRPKVSFSGKARGKLMGFTENWWALCMCSCEIRVHRTTFFFFPCARVLVFAFHRSPSPGGAFLSPCSLQSRLAIFPENICDVRGLPSSPRPSEARRNVKIHRLFSAGMHRKKNEEN